MSSRVLNLVADIQPESRKSVTREPSPLTLDWTEQTIRRKQVEQQKAAILASLPIVSIEGAPAANDSKDIEPAKTDALFESPGPAPPIVPAPITSQEFHRNMATVINRFGDYYGLSQADLIYARDTLVKENKEPKILRTVDIATKHFDFLAGLGNSTKDHTKIRLTSVPHTLRVIDGQPLALTRAYIDKRPNRYLFGVAGAGVGNFVGLAWMLKSDICPLIPPVVSIIGGYIAGRVVDRVSTTGIAMYNARPQVKALRAEFLTQSSR